MKKLIVALFVLASCSSNAQNDVKFAAGTTEEDRQALSEVVYQKEDSILVEKMLRQTPVGNPVLFYARQFIGKPYVAHTLEIHDPEYLVVNLRGLDCTTYVETVLALVMTKQEGKTRFTDYCRNLEKIRYRGGERKGYLSRLHYWTWWMHDNIEKGILTDVQDATYFTGKMVVANDYMTKHPDAYRIIKANPQFLPEITRMEKEQNGPDGYFLPTANTGLPHSRLTMVNDGDVVGIVKMSGGIDISHLGFVAWGKDGKMHLLNASSLAKKVVEDPATLQQYLQRQKRLGVRILKVNIEQ